MPRLSLDAELDRLLAESQDQTRYRDFAMVLRRLTLASKVPEGARLTDDSGRAWIAGEVGEDGVQPVASEVIGASAAAPAGTVLRWDGGAVELRVEVVVEAGGVWDSLRRDWKRDERGERVLSAQPVVVDLMESQIETARWFKDRLAAFREQRPHPHAVAEMISDRRAGKSFLGLLLVIMVGIDCPRVGKLPLVAWLVSTSHPAREELDRIIQAILPASYYTFREMPKRMFVLLNGATLLHKTTDDVESLRTGYVDVALMNEAANMTIDAYQILLRGTQDRSGFLLLATNRPKRTRGNWVIRLADGAETDQRNGIVPALKLLRLDPKKNAAISQAAKSVIDRALRYGIEDGEELDEGLLLEADDKCFSPPWDDSEHIRPLPQVGLVDVTAEITKRLFGRGYNYLLGADWQQQPASAAFKIYAPSFEALGQFRMYCVRAWFLRGGGDEDDMLDVIEASGLNAQECLTIGDSSGHWQKGDHGFGPVSFASLKRRGWEVTAPTKKKTAKGSYPKNPDVEQSVGRLRVLIKEGRFFVVPGEAAQPMAIALKKCDATIDRYKNVRPKGIHAHLCDCARYPAWWLLARPEVVTPAALPAYVTAARR